MGQCDGNSRIWAGSRPGIGPIFSELVNLVKMSLQIVLWRLDHSWSLRNRYRSQKLGQKRKNRIKGKTFFFEIFLKQICLIKCLFLGRKAMVTNVGRVLQKGLRNFSSNHGRNWRIWNARKIEWGKVLIFWQIIISYNITVIYTFLAETWKRTVKKGYNGCPENGA